MSSQTSRWEHEQILVFQKHHLVFLFRMDLFRPPSMPYHSAALRVRFAVPPNRRSDLPLSPNGDLQQNASQGEYNVSLNILFASQLEITPPQLCLSIVCRAERVKVSIFSSPHLQSPVLVSRSPPLPASRAKRSLRLESVRATKAGSPEKRQLP